MSLQDIDKFSEIMDRLEDKTLGPQVVAWLENVTKPSFGLVDTVVETFHEHLESKAISTRVLRLLRQLCTHSPAAVLPQICLNIKFGVSITSYAVNATQEAAEEAFCLVTKVHNAGVDLPIDQAFIEAVFNSFDFLQNEVTYRDLVSLLVDVACTADSDYNLVIEVASTHKNSRYFGEVLLLLLNRVRPPHLLNVVEVVGLLLKSPKTSSGFFYKNDLETLGDIVINAIEDTGEPEVQLKFLEFLDILFKCDDYLQLDYRVADFYTLLRERSDDVSNLKMQAAARQALDYLVLS